MTAIYARQSVDKADSISIALQIETCRTALPPEEPTELYADKGFSGKNTDRPAFQRMLSDVQAGRIQTILAYRLDRISRSVHDFTGLCQTLSECGVQFRSVTDGITLDDSLSGTVMAQILMVFAQFERETIQRRVTDSYFGRAKSGLYLGGLPPFGFRKGETVWNGRRTACYVPDPEQAAQIPMLYETYVRDGASLGTLSRHLTAAEIPTRTGGAWSTLSLGRLLRNPAFVRADAAVFRYLSGKGATLNDPLSAYTGVHGCYCYAPRSPHGGSSRKFTDLSHSFVTLAPHEGLVDAALWLEAQRKLDRNKALKNSGAGTHSWLSGLMKCAKCGYAITVVPRQDGGHYINCGGRKLGCCPGRSRTMTLEEIEGAAEPYVLDFLRHLEHASACERRTPPAEAVQLENQIAAQERELERMTQNLALVEETDVVRLLAGRIHAAGQRLDALRRKRDALLYSAASPDLDAEFSAVLNEWQRYTIAEKKQIAHAILSRVTVSEDVLALTFLGDADQISTSCV